MRQVYGVDGVELEGAGAREAICRALDCKPGDILEYRPEGELESELQTGDNRAEQS